MNGIERAREAWEVFCRPLLEKDYAAWQDKIAVGLVGEGSDCRGYDDKISLDHDTDVGLCLWITPETDAAIGGRLRASYRDMMRRMTRGAKENPRRGVQVIPEFYARFTGLPGAPETLQDWMRIPSPYLSDATNGAVFTDPEGVFTAIREKILYGYPEDVRLKKIAGHLALAAQAGQYNFARSLAHGEEGAAALAVYEFVKHVNAVIFLLNFTHAPFYKWQFRAMRTLPLMGEETSFLESLLTRPLPGKDTEGDVELFAGRLSAVLRTQGLSDEEDVFLESQAKSVTKRISDPEIAALHLMDC